MGKHRKTRKQKIIANFNRQVYILENKNTPLNIPTPVMSINKSSYSYTYVLSDVLKTTILTIVIIFGEIILFFLLNNHIIILPKINY